MARKRVSRKGKKNQRKIDVSDVVDSIEQQNQDALVGGSIETKSNDAIFFVDSGTVQVESRKQVFRNKRLTVEKKLDPNPHTELVYKGDLKALKSKKHPDLTPSTVQKIIAANEQTEIQIQKKVDSNPTKDFKVVSFNNGRVMNAYDLWDGEPLVAPSPVENNEWLEQLKVRPVKLPPKYTPSELPATDVTKPGNSYRPDVAQHQEVLRDVYEDEKKRIEKERKLNRNIHKLKRVISDSEILAEVQADMNGEVDEQNNESEDEKVNIAHLERKTKAERNKQTKRKLEETAAHEEEVQKKLKTDISNVESILAEIENEEKKSKKNIEERNKLKEKVRRVGTKKLGRALYEEDSKVTHVLLTDELPKQLRNISAPEVDLMRERFQSYQRRNMIEVKEKKNIYKKDTHKVIDKKNMEVWIPGL